MRRELVFCAVVILCRLVLTADIPSAQRDLRVDDGLYVRTADHLLAGEWQGPYDRYTLAKSIGYPAFLAGARFVGLPARLAEELLLAAAALALWAALRALGIGPLTAGAAFVLALFSPGNFSPAINRVSRESIYTAQVLLVFAAALTLASRARWLARAGVIAALAALTAWTWHTREESVWLIPPLAAAGLGVFFSRRRDVGTRCAAAEVLACTAVVALAVIGSTRYIAARNEAGYGAPVVVELADEDFAAAIGAIERVTPLRELPFGARTDEDFARLYDVSPALATLRAHIDGPAMRGDYMLVDGYRIHNFQTWVVRDAAALAGHHATLPDAKAFYRRIADEIDAACDRGALPCGAKRARVVPIPRWKDRSRWWDAVTEGGRALATGRTLPGGAGITMPIVEVEGSEASRFRRVLGEPRAPDMSRFFAKRMLFHRIERLLGALMPWLFLAGLTALLVRLVILRRRAFNGVTLAGCVLLAAAATRLLMLAALKAVYFPFAFNYMLAAHVLAATGFVVLLGGSLGEIVDREWAPDRGVRRVVFVLGFAATLAIPSWLAIQAAEVWPRAPWTAAEDLTARVSDRSRRIVLASPFYEFKRGAARGLLAMPRADADTANMKTIDAWIMSPRLGEPHDVVVSGRVLARDPSSIMLEPIAGADVAVIWEGRGEIPGTKGGATSRTAPDGTFQFHLPARLRTAERITLGLVGKPDAVIELVRMDLVQSR